MSRRLENAMMNDSRLWDYEAHLSRLTNKGLKTERDNVADDIVSDFTNGFNTLKMELIEYKADCWNVTL